MMRRQAYSLILVLVTVSLCAWSGDSAPKGHLQRKAAELSEEMAKADAMESTAHRRRAYKRVARGGLAIVEEHAKDPDRFSALRIVMQCQQRLLVLKSSAENQKALLDTCKELKTAPDKYATARLQADALLLQLKLDSRKASNSERTLAFAELADRYRNTPGERDSLILCCQAVFDLGHAELLKAMRNTLAKKFPKDKMASEFLRERFAFIGKRRAASVLGAVDKAFAAGDYKKVLQLLDEIPRPFMTKLHYQTRTRAHCALKEWDKAAHIANSFLEGHFDWSSSRFCCCDSLAVSLLVRAEIQAKLGNAKAAAADTKRSEHIECPPGSSKQPGRQAAVKKRLAGMGSLKTKADLEKGLKAINHSIANNGDGRQYRRDYFAAWFRLRAKAFGGLGKQKEARRDAQHAEALTAGIKSVAYPAGNRGSNGKEPAISYAAIVRGDVQHK